LFGYIEYEGTYALGKSISITIINFPGNDPILSRETDGLVALKLALESIYV
jgi:hypothetical protein